MRQAENCSGLPGVSQTVLAKVIGLAGTPENCWIKEVAVPVSLPVSLASDYWTVTFGWAGSKRVRHLPDQTGLDSKFNRLIPRPSINRTSRVSPV